MSSTPPSDSPPFVDDGGGPITWSWNVATGEVTWSKGIEEALFGLPPGTFEGTFEAYIALVHPDDRNYFQAVIARTLAGEDEYVMSHRAVWSDGSVHWIDGRGRLTRDSEGRPLVLTGIAWTATARKLAEAKLTHLTRVRAVATAVSRELLRVRCDEDAFEHACRIAVEHGHFRFAWIGIVARAETRVVPVARAGHEDGYLEEVGIVPDSTSQGRGPCGRSVREGRTVLVNDIATDDSFAPWREPALRRGYRGCAVFPLRRDGEVVGVLAIYAAEENRFDRDQIELLTGLADDIGFKLDMLEVERRRRIAEEQRNAVQQQLILADRLASLGRLAAGVAHEINNPLSYVAMNLELVERLTTSEPDANGDIRDAVRDARDGADRVREIVRALGSFSREDEGAIRAVDLHRVLDGAIRLSENKVRQHANIIKQYDARRGVHGNDLRLGQVFINLLVNASDALPNGRPEENEIRVHTLDEGARVIVEVQDNGVGIPPENLGRIFDPFFTTKAVGEGTGLGLSISHGIVTAFGGQITVASRPGMTTFRVSLVADGALVGASDTSPKVEVSPVRLLIVDDEERLARTIASLLPHHVVTVATSGRGALELALGGSYDCILCDLMMPDLSGIDLHDALLAAGHGLERRIIFMTGGAFTARALEFVHAISNEVIEKPFEQKRLETSIARLIARHGRSTENGAVGT